MALKFAFLTNLIDNYTFLTFLLDKKYFGLDLSHIQKKKINF